MKKLFFLAILFTGCIETDLQAPLSESIRVALSGESFRVGGTYVLQSEFLNSDGNVEDVPVTWESSDPQVFRIEGNTGIGVSVGTVKGQMHRARKELRAGLAIAETLDT